jgi:hypothetical protein
MRPFRIPESPAALLDEADELNRTVTENIAVAELGADAVQELAEGKAAMPFSALSTLMILAAAVCNGSLRYSQDLCTIW